MRKISNWAKYHPTHARILIVLSHLLLGGIAIFLAWQLFQRDQRLPVIFSVVLVILYITAFLFYPERVPGVKKTTLLYLRQKSCDFIVAVCGFGLALYVTNQVFFSNVPVSQPVSAAMSVVDPAYKNQEAKRLLEAYKSGELTKFSKKEKRILKNEFKYQLGQYAEGILHGDKQKQGSAGLIILAILGAGLLLYLLAGLACTISCNGAEAAALILFILGTAGIIIGLVAVIRAIKRKRKNKEEVPDNTN